MPVAERIIFPSVYTAAAAESVALTESGRYTCPALWRLAPRILAILRHSDGTLGVPRRAIYVSQTDARTSLQTSCVRLSNPKCAARTVACPKPLESILLAGNVKPRGRRPVRTALYQCAACHGVNLASAGVVLVLKLRDAVVR